MKVLVVEDSRDTARLLALTLGPADLDVILRTDDFGTLYQSEDWASIDVVICDQWLENYDGKDALVWIARNHPHIRRIMLTADAALNDVDVCAHHVFVKPVDAANLIEAVKGTDDA